MSVRQRIPQIQGYDYTCCLPQLILGSRSLELAVIRPLLFAHQLCPAVQVGVFLEHGEDRSAMLVSMVPQFTALADLTIRYINSQMDGPSASDVQGLPRCRELADLHSRSLTRLRADVLANPEEGNTLRLVGLPELRCCQLRSGVGMGLEDPVGLCIDAASFRGAPRLESLRIRNDEGLQLLPGSLEALTGLTSLTLDRCGLRTVPPGVAALGANLRVLDLDSNARLQFDEAGVAAVLQCSRLTTLGLAKGCIKDWRYRLDEDVWQPIGQFLEDEGYVPAQFSVESVSHLMQLPSAFRERHARDLTIWLHEEEHHRGGGTQMTRSVLDSERAQMS